MEIYISGVGWNAIIIVVSALIVVFTIIIMKISSCPDMFVEI